MSTSPTLGWHLAHDHGDLLASPVSAALGAWEHAASVLVAGIDPDHADTATLVEVTGLPAEQMGNCVVVAGRRGEVERVAACVVSATTRADVNGLVRRSLDVRKASFLPRERAVAATGMEFGGITPIGLPGGWRLLVDEALTRLDQVIIGSGVRRSKLALPGGLLASLPGAEVVAGLGVAVT